MKKPDELFKKIEELKKENPLDLSREEDLAVGIMNLISIEEHLFFTIEKTGTPKYLDLLNDVRKIRIKAYQKLIADPEGEVWCIGKHLLAASMRLMEVGTKALKAGNKQEARIWFDNSFNLFGLFWKVVQKDARLPGATASVPNKNQEPNLSGWLKKTLNCCKE